MCELNKGMDEPGRNEWNRGTVVDRMGEKIEECKMVGMVGNGTTTVFDTDIRSKYRAPNIAENISVVNSKASVLHIFRGFDCPRCRIIRSA